MSTYLQLCQQTHRLIRAGNNTPGSQPTTVVGNTDPLLLDIIYFVAEAYNQIQSDHPSWIWMVNSATLVLPINASTGFNQTLPIATIVAAYPTWRNFMPKMSAQYRYALIFDSGVTNPPTHQPIYFMPWMEFDGFFNRLPRSPGQPIRMTEDPQRNIIFDPPPLNAPSAVTNAYNVLCNYRTVNQVLAADADVPLMPADFHDLIVYWAGMLYCQTRSTTSALSEACQANMQRILFKLRAYSLPEMVIDDRYC